MISRLLGAVSSRVSAADLVVKSEETLSLSLDEHGVHSTVLAQSQGVQLRVLYHGRVGWAGTTRDDPSALPDAAIAAAETGESLDLFLPAPAATPSVLTRSRAAVSAGSTDLADLGRALQERLAHSGRRVEAWVERSAGEVQVGNTRGVMVDYEVSLVGLGAAVASAPGEAAPRLRVHVAGTALPTHLEIESLVAEVDQRLTPPPAGGALPVGTTRVCFRPRAVAALLRPLRAALQGRTFFAGASPLSGKLDQPVLDERLTLTDDPLAPGRPGSRPVDDEGVPARRHVLIDRGRLAGAIADLTVGASFGVPSTGNSWRTPLGAPRVGFTNLRLAPGPSSPEELLGEMGDGLLVEDLSWPAGPNPLSGTFVLAAPWTYAVRGGEVAGRVDGTVLRGNLFDLLRRVVAVGADVTWIGAQCLPSLVLEGVVWERDEVASTW